MTVSDVDINLGQILLGKKQLTPNTYELCEAEGLLPIAADIAPKLETRHRKIVHQAVAAELAHSQMVIGALSALDAAGLDVLVIKGTALAYTLYDSPWQRSRNDTDLVIRESDFDPVADILSELGFEKQVSLPGRLVVGELAFSAIDKLGIEHTLDVHWRLNNSWRLASLIRFEDLWQSRIAIPTLGDGAYTCAPDWALLIAAMHRISHLTYVAYEMDGVRRMEADFTLWAYDVHLLAAVLDEDKWNEVCRCAIDRKMGKFLEQALLRSVSLFDTDVPVSILNRLRSAAGQYSIDSMNSALSADLQNFMAVPGWRLRFGWLWQQVFPSAKYMREKHGPDSFLPGRYAERILFGFAGRGRRRI